MVIPKDAGNSIGGECEQRGREMITKGTVTRRDIKNLSRKEYLEYFKHTGRTEFMRLRKK